MTGAVALIPARRGSVRAPRKNVRPFWRGLSLVQIKVMTLFRSETVSRVIVSSDDELALEQAAALGADTRLRDSRLCHEHVDLGELFTEVLAGQESNIVYWAHPTSPFVRPETVDAAVEFVVNDSSNCVLGVQRLQDFLWKSQRPLNYDPRCQPRSQDLEPVWRVTGGIHVAMGWRFIEQRSLAFDPVVFRELTLLESFDIDTEEEWHFCSEIASGLPEALRDLLP